MQRSIERLERFFWIYLLLNPVLDYISGLYIRFVTNGDVYNSAISMPLTPSLVIRMAVLLVMIAYIFMIKDWQAVKIAIPMGIAWGMSIVSELITYGQISLFIDIQYFARFAYNIAVLFVYSQLIERSKLTADALIDKIHRYITWMLFLLTVVIVVPYIWGAGYYTYADRFGYRGFRGFYYSGNDITGALMILFPVAACYFLSMKLKYKDWKTFIKYAAPLAMTMLSMLLIGTKTAFLAIGVAGIAIFIYAIIKATQKDFEPLKRVISVVLLFALLFLIISALTMFFNGTDMGETIRDSLKGIALGAGEGNGTLLFSGRLNKLIPTFYEYQNAGPFAWIFGIGRGSQVETIEMDLCEVLLYYGLFGVVTMLWLYLHRGVSFVLNFFRRFNVLALGAFLSLGLCVAYLTIAGHVLFTVTSGFYFSFALIYAGFVTRKPN